MKFEFRKKKEIKMLILRSLEPAKLVFGKNKQLYSHKNLSLEKRNKAVVNTEKP